MKKIFCLMLALMMVLSCSLVSASNKPTVTLSIEDDTNTAGDVIKAVITLSNTSTLYMAQVTVGFNGSVVTPVNASGDVKENVAACIGSHKNDTDGDGLTYWGQQQVKASVAEGYFDYTISAAGSDNNTTVNIDDPWKVITIRFKRSAAGDAGFKITNTYAGNPEGALIQTTNTSGNVAINIVNPTVEEPDNTIVGKDAKGVATTNGISFAGKVRADLLDKDYGVVVNGKKFAGAKVDDKVWDGTGEYGNSTVVMTGKAWDGTFQIDLTNIFDKVDATSITATGNFYVGSETQAYTDVVVDKAN